MAELTYDPPGEIDGEPREVATAAARQLLGLLTEISEIADQTGRQVLNAVATTALEEGLGAERELEPGELEDWVLYHRPLQADALYALKKARNELEIAAAELERAVRDDA